MSYNYKEYNVYEKESLFQTLGNITDISDDIKTFYETFNIENVLKENEARTTSNFVFKNRIKEDGYEKVKGKFDWMYNRISTDEHRKFAEENYKKWSKELEKYK